MKHKSLIGLLRIGMGGIFLWAFLDKLLGLGFATTSDKAWLQDASPTTGFLKFGTHGPFKDFFAGLAGNPLVDILFMTGLLCVGLALLLGVAQKLATVGGSLMLTLMWLAAFPPENNPLLDDHVIYILVLLLLLQLNSGEKLGIATWWGKTTLVKKYPILR